MSSNIITKSSLFDNHDVGNAERNYPGLENNEVFFKIDLIDAYQNPKYPNQKYSWVNMWSLDFFGEYFYSNKSNQRYPNKNKDIKYNRISLIVTLLFIPWYLFSLIKVLKKKTIQLGELVLLIFVCDVF